MHGPLRLPQEPKHRRASHCGDWQIRIERGNLFPNLAPMLRTRHEAIRPLHHHHGLLHLKPLKR
jgi:hypothetical protein